MFRKQKARTETRVVQSGLFAIVPASVQESLLAQSLQQDLRNLFVCGLRIAVVGEYLGQILRTIHLHEMPVLGHGLLLRINPVDILFSVCPISLLVNQALDGKSLRLGRTFIGITYGNGRNRYNQLRQFQSLDQTAGRI